MLVEARGRSLQRAIREMLDEPDKAGSKLSESFFNHGGPRLQHGLDGLAHRRAQRAHQQVYDNHAGGEIE
jgi:hypothetical protein